MISMLDTTDLEMKFPESTLKSEQDFRDWYKVVTNKFFDQVHEVKMLNVDVVDDAAAVHLVVNWQAKTWNPPEGYSRWNGAYVHQSWKMEQHTLSTPEAVQQVQLLTAYTSEEHTLLALKMIASRFQVL